MYAIMYALGASKLCTKINSCFFSYNEVMHRGNATITTAEEILYFRHHLLRSFAVAVVVGYMV